MLFKALTLSLLFFNIAFINKSNFGASSNRVGIICIAKNEQEFNRAYKDIGITGPNKSKIIVLCEEYEDQVRVNHNLEIRLLCDFNQILKRFDYVLIIKPELLSKYITGFGLSKTDLNSIYLGNINTAVEYCSVAGNFYDLCAKRFVNKLHFSQVKDFIYENIYSTKLLNSHFNGKSASSIYIVEVFLQACIYYNRGRDQ